MGFLTVVVECSVNSVMIVFIGPEKPLWGVVSMYCIVQHFRKQFPISLTSSADSLIVAALVLLGSFWIHDLLLQTFLSTWKWKDALFSRIIRTVNLHHCQSRRKYNNVFF